MKNLFDASFSKYIAPTVVKVIYVLIMIMIGIFYLIFVVSAFSANQLMGWFTMLILGPLVALLYLVMIRVGLESMLATIRTAENTTELLRLASYGQAPGGGSHAAAGYRGPYPSGQHLPEEGSAP